MDITLEVGSTTESISVSGAAPLLATETALAGQVLEGKTIVRIPVQQTAASRMLYYFPTVISSQSYHISGQRLRGMGFSIDGVTAKQPGTATFGDNDEILQMSPEGIAEAKVTTTAFPPNTGTWPVEGSTSCLSRVQTSLTARSGRSTSGSRWVNGPIWTRPNSTTWRGTMRGLTAPSRARSIFRSCTTAEPDLFPVHYARLLPGRRRAGISSWTSQRPQMYNGDFSFGGIGQPIYNPFTTRQNADRDLVRDPFPNNQVPKSLFDPAVQNFLGKSPFSAPNNPGIPTRPGLTESHPRHGQEITAGAGTRRSTTSSIANHKIFGRYSEMWEPTWMNTSYRGSARVARYRSELAKHSHRQHQQRPLRHYDPVADAVQRVPDRVQPARQQRAVQPTYGQDWAKQLGIPNVDPRTFPVFAIGYGLAGLPVSRLVGEDLTLQDNFTQVKGRHTIKAGYEMVRTRVDSVLPSLPSGTYNFGGTELPFTPNTGNTFASFLLGTVSSASFTNTYASWLPRWWQHALYVQDDWKIARGLTLNFGLRWSYESPFQTKYGQAAQFDPTGVDPLTGLKGAITHNPGPLAKGDWNNFQPRLGLAWHLRPKWVFRSSFGIMTQDGYRTAYNQNFQEYVGTANVQQLPGNPSHVFLLSQGPPAVNYALQSNGTVPYLGTNYSARAADWYDPNMHAPYIMMWSGGFQYQFARDWLVETLYEGSAGVGLLENWNINQIPLDVSPNPAVLGQIFRATQNYLPYPQFGTINLFSNFGHNTHHAATLRVEKRYAVGLTVLETYTFQKTMDDCDVDGACTGVSYYNRSLEKARAGYDITHHFLHMMTYDLPFGKGRRWLNREDS